jgi:hypothetical protein
LLIVSVPGGSWIMVPPCPSDDTVKSIAQSATATPRAEADENVGIRV